MRLEFSESTSEFRDPSLFAVNVCTINRSRYKHLCILVPANDHGTNIRGADLALKQLALMQLEGRQEATASLPPSLPPPPSLPRERALACRTDSGYDTGQACPATDREAAEQKELDPAPCPAPPLDAPASSTERDLPGGHVALNHTHEWARACGWV